MRKLLALVVLFSAPAAFACSCAPIGPACKAFWAPFSQAVFVGHVESVKTVTPPRKDRFSSDGWPYRLVTFTVTESFTPDTSGQVQVRTGMGSSDCGLPFEVGKDYLVWASGDGKDKKLLYTGLCSRTRELRWAVTDLEFLRSLPKRKETGWIFGEAKEYTFDPNFKRTFEPSIMDHYRPDEEAYRSLKHLTGVVVTATDEKGKVYSTTVNEDGDFKIDDLTPGVYTTRLQVPDSMLVWPANPRSFSLRAKACEEIRYRTALDGRISGVLRDAGGAPVKYTYVELVDVAHPDHPERQFEMMTEEDGHFEFKALPPGDYYLSVNRKAAEYSEFVPTFYPGVESSSVAEVIHLGAAQKLQNLDFKARRKKK